ncbi:MAG: hypothetical protein EXR93_04160 [Gemmatimonadetes bacterium]|nr:hypothetical protein [Gemmatimonadota bacterium]
MISAVILAAGESSRMGRPKALLELGGMTFVELIANAVRSAAITDVMIAVAHDDAKIAKYIDLHSLTSVYNTTTPVAVPL